MGSAMTAKKKLVGAIGGVAALGATVALTAGTFSYFSDSGSVKGDVSFGTLELELQEGAAEDFSFDKAAPGQTVLPTKNMTFFNAGDMDGELRVRFSEKDPAADAYNKALLVTLKGFSGIANGTYTLDELAAKTAGGYHLANLTHGGVNDGYAYKGFQMTVAVDKNAGNELQGAEGGFTLEADLVQSGADGRALEYPAPAFPAAPAQP
jgi:hypothetical protein